MECSVPELLRPALRSCQRWLGGEAFDLHEVEAGFTNRVVRFSTQGGSWFAKWTELGERRQELIAREGWALDRLTGTGHGPARHRLWRRPDNGLPILLQEAIPGATLEEESLAAKLTPIARRLASVHGIKPRRTAWSGDFDGPREVWESSVELFGAYLRRREASGLRPDLLLTLWGEALREASRALLATLSRSGRPRPALCHGDPRAHNFIAAGEELRLIDWEFALVADPATDLAWLSVLNGFDQELDERLVSEYGQASGWPDAGMIGRFFAYRRLFSFTWPLTILLRLYDVDSGEDGHRGDFQPHALAESRFALDALRNAFARYSAELGWPAPPGGEQLREMGELARFSPRS